MRLLTALLLAGVAGLWPLPADAQASDASPASPAVPDTLARHLTISASAALAVPFGSLNAGTSASSLTGSGAGFGAEVGYGVSHTVVVGVWGQMLRLGGGSTCSSCSTTSFAGGPFVSYHLVQGVRFDPWMSAALGFRTATISGSGADKKYSGVEWLRLQVGGDWYAFRNLGIGPFLELDTGWFYNHPAATAGALHWQFLAGARLTFDLPGK